MKSNPTTTPKYPHINISLVGEDGNAFAILGRTSRALRRHNVPKEKVDLFMKQAMSGDYNHLLCTVMDWVATDGEELN
jgi:hypothetical protein